MSATRNRDRGGAEVNDKVEAMGVVEWGGGTHSRRSGGRVRGGSSVWSRG